jgi:hypothetical protein
METKQRPGTAAMGRAVMGLGLAAAILVGACAKQGGEASAPTADAAAVPGAVNRKGSFLAYEHEVSIRLPAARIAGNVAAVHEACMSERFGSCSVLSEEVGAGEYPSGSVQLRAEPKAIPALAKLAADGGEVGQRSTHAEDLADAVHNNGLSRQRLQLQHDKLIEVLARRDIKVEDIIVLNQKLADIETELQGAEQEAAQQQRRIETNLLTLHFNSSGISAESSRVREAFRGLGGIWDASLGNLITIVGALLPFVLFAALVWWIGGWIHRRMSRKPNA